MSNVLRSLSMALFVGGASLALTACQSNPFTRQPKPTPRYVPDITYGSVQTLSILPTRVSCRSALPMQCLLATQDSSAQPFQIPYDWIDGFEPKLGVQYQIQVKPQLDAKRSSDQQRTGHWQLVSIVSQTLVNPAP